MVYLKGSSSEWSCPTFGRVTFVSLRVVLLAWRKGLAGVFNRNPWMQSLVAPASETWMVLRVESRNLNAVLLVIVHRMSL